MSVEGNLCVHVCTQGDGVSYDSLKEICASVKEKGWSLDNLAFGSGGGLLQKVHRDTQKCAFKCCYACIDGQDVGVFMCMHGTLPLWLKGKEAGILVIL